MKLETKKPISRLLSRWQVVVGVVVILGILELAGLRGGVSYVGVKVTFLGQGLARETAQVFVQARNKVVSLPKSAQKIQDLELRLAESSVALGELDHLRKENEELRELLGDVSFSQGERVVTSPVMILARPSLSVGSSQGIEEGSLVSSKGVLLGRVKKVFADYAQVELLTEKDARPILVQTESGVQGIVRGDGRRVLLTEVASGEEIRVGERVMTVGQSDFPAGLFIGRIVQAKNDPVAATQTAILEQYTSFYEVPVVEVR